MTNLILPTHVAKARAKQVKKEAKKKEEAKLPEPTGWRLLILPHSGKGKTKGGIIYLIKQYKKNKLQLMLGLY